MNAPINVPREQNEMESEYLKKLILILRNILGMKKKKSSSYELNEKVNCNVEHKFNSSRILIGGEGRGRAFFAVKPKTLKTSKTKV